MRRALPGGFELDDDPTRIDIDAVHRYLSEQSYWAAGRSRETVEQLVRLAARVVGLYQGGEQVGFARAASDGVAVAYLADVYVLSAHRGRGSASSSCARWSSEARTRASAGCSTRPTRTGSTSGLASARRESG